LKVCGDFLSGEAVDFLSYLGLDPGDVGAVPVDTLILSSGAKTAKAALPFPAAGLSRARLDETLLARATSYGVEVIRGVSATALRLEDGLATVATEGVTFRGKSAALATGKHNLRGRQRPAGEITAFKMQFSLGRPARAHLTGRVALAAFDGGHIGACMTEDDLTTICWQIDTRKLEAFGSDWQAQLATIRCRSPAFSHLLENGRPIRPRPAAVSNLPFGYVRRAPIGDNIYPLGDQMAVVPSFTGDGTALALSSGILAARALLDGKTAPTYQAAFAGRLRPQFAVASAVSSVMRSRLGRSIGIGAVRAMPSAMAMLARATRHGEPAQRRLPRYRSSATK
jgi:flavin-dependent dehydrogenase